MKNLVLLVVIALSACAVAPVVEKSGPMPEDAADIARQFLLDVLVDPGSLSQFKVIKPAEPCAVSGIFQATKYGWCITFEYNAKNRLGGYVGKKAETILIRDGQVASVMDASQYF